MGTWFMDPKSISLIAGAAIQLVITVWHSRQTAELVDELVKWRLTVTAHIAKLEEKVDTNGEEIGRLRDRAERDS
jgi:hypothetical protein